MLIRSPGDTNVHIINRVGGSGTEWRLQKFLRSSGFMAQTGLLADNVHFCRTRNMVFRHLNLTHFLVDRSECLTDINTQTQGSAMRFVLIPTMYANGRVDRPIRIPPHGIVTISDLGEVGCLGSRARSALDTQANFRARRKTQKKNMQTCQCARALHSWWQRQ